MGAGNKTGSQPQGRHGLTREDLVGESAPLPAFHRGISRISRRPSQTEAAAKASQLEVVQLVLNLAFRFHLQSGSIWFYKATDAWEDERPVGTHGLWSLSCQVAALRSHEKFGLGDGAQHQVLLAATALQWEPGPVLPLFPSTPASSRHSLYPHPSGSRKAPRYQLPSRAGALWTQVAWPRPCQALPCP